MVKRMMANPMRASGCGASWELLGDSVGLVVMVFLSVRQNLFSVLRLACGSAESKAQI
jgi:hypothetical protein